MVAVMIGELAGLTKPSSATAPGGARRKSRASKGRSLERVVRLAPTELTEGPAWLRRGNDGHCRRENVNRAGDVPEGRTCRQNGNTLGCEEANTRSLGTGRRWPPENPREPIKGLTDPSSATAHGAVDVGYREMPTAMSRSLERVVRRRVFRWTASPQLNPFGMDCSSAGSHQNP